MFSHIAIDPGASGVIVVRFDGSGEVVPIKMPSTLAGIGVALMGGKMDAKV